MDKWQLIIDWIEYVASITQAIAKAAGTLRTNWPKRPASINRRAVQDSVTITGSNDSVNAK